MHLVRTVALLSLAVLLVACFGRDETALHGTWTIDVDKQIEEFKQGEAFKALPEAVQETTLKQQREMWAKQTVTFKAEGKMEMKLGEGTIAGEYKVKEMTDNDNWVMESKLEGQESFKQATVTWLDDNTMKSVQGEGAEKTTMFFKRK